MSDTNNLVRNDSSAHASDNCTAINETLSRIGDKWTVLVVCCLQHGPLRYNQILRRLGGISQRMLTLTLKALEHDGIVERTMFPIIPPRVDYELTELGRSLLVPLQAVFRWAVECRPLMLEARKRFDQRTKL